MKSKNEDFTLTAINKRMERVIKNLEKLGSQEKRDPFEVIVPDNFWESILEEDSEKPIVEKAKPNLRIDDCYLKGSEKMTREFSNDNAHQKIVEVMGEEKKEYIAPENHIVYSPAGGIHGLMNMSDTETAELIFTYGNCPSRDAAGTVFLEEPWMK